MSVWLCKNNYSGLLGDRYYGNTEEGGLTLELGFGGDVGVSPMNAFHVRMKTGE